MDTLSAIISGVFGLGSSALGYFGQQEANSMNYDMWQRNMDWQTYMSNTAHQREVKDLVKAGLNPVLSANHGGASTGTPTMQSMVNPLKDIAQNLASSKIIADIMQSKSVAKMNEENAKLIKEARRKTVAEANRAELLNKLDFTPYSIFMHQLDKSLPTVRTVGGAIGSALMYKRLGTMFPMGVSSARNFQNNVYREGKRRTYTLNYPPKKYK